MGPFNVYEDPARAAGYAALQFTGTYHLAFRDLPDIVRRHVTGDRAVDFGCGAGRSTRLLRDLGFAAVGVDAAPAMIAQARRLDPAGDYRLTDGQSLGPLASGVWDLVLSAFTFDNIPEEAQKARILRDCARVLRRSGCLIQIVSSPELYLHEWVSISTRPFPENRAAVCGDVVRTIITDTRDARPVDDVLCTGERYAALFADAGFDVAAIHRPLATGQEPWPWVNETRIAPWTIYVLRVRSETA